MTQTVIDTLSALGLIALYFGGPVAALALVFYGRQRAQRRYHVGHPHSRVPVRTYRTRAAAVRGSVEFHRETGRCGRITVTR
jgi:hypothetical protein